MICNGLSKTLTEISDSIENTEYTFYTQNSRYNLKFMTRNHINGMNLFHFQDYHDLLYLSAFGCWVSIRRCRFGSYFVLKVKFDLKSAAHSCISAQDGWGKWYSQQLVYIAAANSTSPTTDHIELSLPTSNTYIFTILNRIASQTGGAKNLLTSIGVINIVEFQPYSTFEYMPRVGQNLPCADCAY